MDHVGVLAGEDVVADVLVLLLDGCAADGVDDDGAILAGVAASLRIGASSAFLTMLMPTLVSSFLLSAF
jgi:hypothetical protein